MSEKPEPQDDATAKPAVDVTQEVDLTVEDLDQAAGGGWPFVTTPQTYNKGI